MKTSLKLEELRAFLPGIFAFGFLNYQWWWFPVLIPNTGVAGYLFGNRTGAFFYNLFHHKGVAVLVFLSRFYLENHILQLSGIILFSHSAVDRMLNYGLKYEKGFKFTHLGEIGKSAEKDRTTGSII